LKHLLFLATLALLFSACSEKKEEHSTTQKVASSTDIAVSDNDKAYEQKIVSSTDKGENKSYYYEDKKELEKRSVVDANVHVRSPYEDVQISLMVKRLSKHFRLKCSPCHNDYANGLIGPSLLDKDSDFIFNTIMKYRNGEKKNVLMKEMVTMMSEEEISELATEIDAFNKEVKKLRGR